MQPIIRTGQNFVNTYISGIHDQQLYMGQLTIKEFTIKISLRQRRTESYKTTKIMFFAGLPSKYSICMNSRPGGVN